jgi:hypothetical protein
MGSTRPSTYSLPNPISQEFAHPASTEYNKAMILEYAQLAAWIAGGSVPMQYDNCPLDECILNSHFGPRLVASQDYRYDFHRGIDLKGEIGDSVYAIDDGSVFRVYPDGGDKYTNSGNVLILKHEDNAGERYYSLYFHLDSFDVEQDDEITSGQLVARLGDTDASYPHLHFEIREGTTNSRESQISSGDDLGYDPHVDPLKYLTAGESLVHGVRIRDDRNWMQVVVPKDHPGFSGISWTEANGSEGHADFSTRAGFDDTSTDALDEAIQGEIKWIPKHFNTSKRWYKMKIKWLNSPELETVTIHDIWGNSFEYEWPNN